MAHRRLLVYGCCNWRATAVVTWEMPDGTEFCYDGVGIESNALRQFVLRFMGTQAGDWDALYWSDQQLADAFERRFGHEVDVRRERGADGSARFVFRARLSFA